MGCFPVCFGPWKHKKTMKKLKYQSLSPSHEAATLLDESPKQETDNTIPESEAKSEEQMIVTLDHSSVEKDTNQHMGSNNNDKLVENQSGSNQEQREKDEDDGFNSNSEKNVENSASREGQDSFIGDNSKGGISSQEDCCPATEESYDSLFSLSIDSRKHVYAVEMGDSKEVTSPLKPIQNSSIESKKNVNLASFKYDDDDEEDKENVKVDGNRKTMKPSTLKQSSLAKRENENVVDTSLSSWLVEHEKSAQKAGVSVGINSPDSEKNYGDRTILKHLNEPSSGGSTPSGSADNQPSIGTVGRYWQRRNEPTQVL